MKAIKRKLLSLVLAMAMVLSLAPTALAADDYTVSVTVTNPTTEPSDGYTAGSEVTLSASVTAGNEDGAPLFYTWTGATPTGTNSSTAKVNGTNETKQVTCTVSNSTDTADPDYKSGSGTAAVKFAAAAVDTTANTLEPSQVSIDLTAGSNTAVTVTVKNEASTALSGKTVTATVKSGSASLTGLSVTPSAVTNSSGIASFSITSTAASVGNTRYVFSCDGKTVELPISVTAAETTTITLSQASLALTPNGNTGEITATVKQGTQPVSGETVSFGTVTGSNGTVVKNTISQLTIRTPGGVANSSSATTDANGRVTIAVTPGSVSGTVTIPVTVSGAKTQNLTVTVGNSGTASLVAQTGYPTVGSSVSLDNWYNYDNTIRYRTFAVNPSVPGYSTVTQINAAYNVSYTWYLGSSSTDRRYPQTNSSTYQNSYTLYSNNSDLYNYGAYYNNVLICVATFQNKQTLVTDYTATAYWNIGSGYTGNVFASATVYRSSGSYALGEKDDANNSSIVTQLDNHFYNYNSASYYYGYGLAYVQFVNTTDSATGSSLSATAGASYYGNYRNAGSNYALANVLFYPGSTTGTATFRIRAYYYTSNTATTTSYVEGAITFYVTGEAYNGDITYSGSIGSDVAFRLKDFEDFYYNKARGSLSYVSFALPSGGYLYADSGRLNNNNACYVSPNRNQTDLAGVYFSPTGTTATRANTVRIAFTAYGTRASTNGTVVITYLSGSARDITYNIYASGSLKASDFTDAYRQVVGSAAPTGLTIEFQNAPAYGGLSYKDSSRGNSTLVTLRSSNIKSYKFTTLSTGTNQLGDVTYTANGNHSDTIDYIAYVNNTPQFTGKVIFNGSTSSAANMQVGFTSTNGQAVPFSYVEFSKANAAVIAMTSSIRFVSMPSGGTLTYNGAVMTLSSTNVTPANLGHVSYRPTAGFNNDTDHISFMCYDANGNSVGGGQVNIIVTGNTNVNSGSTGTTNVNQFKDVSATAWYRDDLSRLVNAGIIKGKGDGKFDPKGELTYGEALKIFMLASGYSTQVEPAGQNWAINYKNQAASNGWIGNDVNLNAKISRNAMAELVAKSLGVSPNSTVPAVWKDGTSNDYSNALYYTNPQILIGNDDGTFEGTSTLQREQICAIACRVMNYKSNQQSADKPGWIS